MIAIIPALLRTAADVAELAATLRSIPADVVGQCVIASKGLQPRLDEVPRDREYVVLHSEVSTTKWQSIAQGIQTLPDTSDRVLLIDADDPFEAGSLRDFCLHADSSEANLVVGRRDRVILVAEDQRTPQTRLFIEVFSNTLLLARLGRLHEQGAAVAAHDIQSGLYASPANVLRRVSFDAVKMYGGELTLYHTLAAAGAKIDERTVTAHEVLQSSYLSREIFSGLFGLPFFAHLTDDELNLALSEGPRLYAEWMPGGAAGYREEINALLSARLAHTSR
jgi:hypothetical protein